MAIYRPSRNIESSIIQYIEEQLTLGGWSDVHVEKNFARVFGLPLPSICVRAGVTVHEKVELGSDATTRNPQVLIDIFATSDGQKLDIKDFLVEKLKGGCVYYLYTTKKDGRETVIDTKTANGRIRVLDIDDTPIDFDVDKEKLEVHNRYRHLLTLSISLGKVEA